MHFECSQHYISSSQSQDDQLDWICKKKSWRLARKYDNGNGNGTKIVEILKSQ